MQNKSTKTIREIWSEVKVFLELKAELYKLNATEKVVKVFADIVTNTTVLFFCLVAFLAAAVTLAFYFSSLLSSYTAGFGIAALFFLLFAIVVFLIKDKFLEKWITNIAVRRYFEKHYNEEES